jgi:hypothetical protein
LLQYRKFYLESSDMDLVTVLTAIPDAGPVLPYITALIAVCAAVAAALPHPADGGTGVYRVFYTVLNFVAFNIGKARNADVSASRPPSGKA